MKVKFIGIVEKRTSGCSACGRRKSQSQFQHTKEYILPSGVRKKFRAGVPTEVTDEDGDFLLGYTYTSNGEIRNVFEQV